jgi:hypothetical protein
VVGRTVCELLAKAVSRVIHEGVRHANALAIRKAIASPVWPNNAAVFVDNFCLHHGVVPFLLVMELCENEAQCERAEHGDDELDSKFRQLIPVLSSVSVVRHAWFPFSICKRPFS